MRSPSGGGSPPRREPTPELNTFAELVRMECNFFADDHDLVGAAELLRLHGIRLPVGGGGEAGLREGLALISWVEIHLLMPGDWEDLPDGVKAQLARLLGADEGSLADQDCIQKLRLKWMLNVQLQTAAVDADAELISLPASEMDTAAHDLAAWLDTPPNRRTPLLRLHTARLPTPPLDDDMPSRRQPNSPPNARRQPNGRPRSAFGLRSDGGGAQGRAGGLYRELPERLSA